MARFRRSFHDVEGYNGRLDAIQAAFLRIGCDISTAGNRSITPRPTRYNELLVQRLRRYALRSNPTRAALSFIST